MRTLNIENSVVNTMDELREDLSGIILSKIPIDALSQYPVDVTGESYEYADEFNYLSLSLIPEGDIVNVHIEFGVCNAGDFVLVGGGVVNWWTEKMEVEKIETLHLHGEKISLREFLEEIKKVYLSLPRVGSDEGEELI